MSTTTTAPSAELRARAFRSLPGGVSASGRHNLSLGGALYLLSAQGWRVTDIDGVEYIDFNLSHGAAFRGCGHPTLHRAPQTALENGILSGYETEAHTELVRLITDIIPGAERVRYATPG